eukprot:COSAG01_NODE_2435_length_7701_cov_7.604709_8_plen_34_part_00
MMSEHSNTKCSTGGRDPYMYQLILVALLALSFL